MGSLFRLVRFVVVAMCVSTGAATAADPGIFSLGVGQYDIIPNDNKSIATYLQYRFGVGPEQPSGFLGVKPVIGAMANTDGGLYGYAGLAAPFTIGSGGFQIEPAAGVGAYRQGHSTNLGGTFEFHLGLSATQRIGRALRVGVALNHISNANIHVRNRGTNVAMATVGWEFR